MAGRKTNSFILCTEQQWKSGSRFQRAAHRYLTDMTHQPASTTTALSHLCASGLFLLPDTNTRSPPLPPKAETSSIPLRIEGRPTSSTCHGPLSHLFIPCVSWQSPKSNKNPSKDLGKQTKLCTDEMSFSGKKRLAWFGKRAEKLISH